MNHETHILKRVAAYLELLLVSAGFTLLKAPHLEGHAVIAGRDNEGFVLMLEFVDEHPASSRPDFLGDLSFLKLPQRLVQVSERSLGGRELLSVFIDADLLAQMPEQKPREFGIGLQAKLANPA